MTWSLSRVRRQLSIFLLSSVTRQKKKIFKKKREENFWTTWWLDLFRGYVGNLVSFAEFSHAHKKKKKKIQKKNHTKKKRSKRKKKSSKKKSSKKIFCWTTWWLDSSPGYVGSLVLFTEFSHMKRRRIASLAWRVFQRSSICF